MSVASGVPGNIDLSGVSKVHLYRSGEEAGEESKNEALRLQGRGIGAPAQVMNRKFMK